MDELDDFMMMIEEGRFSEAHVVLEHPWKVLRAESKDEGNNHAWVHIKMDIQMIVLTAGKDYPRTYDPFVCPYCRHQTIVVEKDATYVYHWDKEELTD